MSKPTVGWIGLGAMGSGMAKVCLSASYSYQLPSRCIQADVSRVWSSKASLCKCTMSGRRPSSLPSQQALPPPLHPLMLPAVPRFSA